MRAWRSCGCCAAPGAAISTPRCGSFAFFDARQEKGAVAMALWLPFIRKGFLPLAWAVSFHTEIRDQRNSTLAQRLLLIAKLLVANGAKVELLPRRKQHSFRAMVDEGHQRRLRRKIEVPQPNEFKAKQLKRPAPPEDAPRKRRSLREIRQYLQLS
ncbi:unnamed protein product [Effrenium voratum]|nr:unnamed protein product [Effrenium voratum]